MKHVESFANFITLRQTDSLTGHKKNKCSGNSASREHDTGKRFKLRSEKGDDDRTNPSSGKKSNRNRIEQNSLLSHISYQDKQRKLKIISC